MIDPSLYKRKVIHFDMDAFYASVEVRDNPTLAGKALIIGGSPESRSVVCTASYEARKFGVRSAMPCSKAARLCPEAIFMEPNFDKYRSVSQQIREIFGRYTSLIEPLSLDEAYLDVTENERGYFAVKIARLIQNDIIRELGLTGSAGVAPNKLVAKVASDMRKPCGITVVTPEMVEGFMRKLPLRKLHGIGPATDNRLAKLGLHLCEDVWPYSVEQLRDVLGNLGPWLHQRSRGIDERPVEAKRVRKSIGKETTFETDLSAVTELLPHLESLCASVSGSLRRRNIEGRTVTLKIRYADFTLVTRSLSLNNSTSDKLILLESAKGLLQKTEVGQKKVRLLGVSVSKFNDAPKSQVLHQREIFAHALS